MPQEQPIRNRYAASAIPDRVFWMPFAYLYRVRLGTFPKLLSWMLLYLMPAAFYSAWGNPCPPLRFVLNFLLVLWSTFTLYETGYIHNDTFATRREHNPALRLYDTNLNYFYRHWKAVFACRAAYAVAGLTGLFLLNGNTPAFWRTAAAILLIIPLFLLYNHIRSRWNTLLYPLLVFSRYIPFMLLYPIDPLSVLLLFLSFPCLNMLERFSMPKYRFPLMRRLIPEERSKTAFRVAYYALLTPLLALWFHAAGISLWRLLPLCLLAAYRFALWILLRHTTPKNYLQG